MVLVQDVPEFFPRRIRGQIERLACKVPSAVGWNITHWSTRSLAQAAIEKELIDSIAHTTVGEILRGADLQPHRFRYWKSTTWDDEAIARAIKILWYYRRIESLWSRGEVVLALDEKPNLQVLERIAPSQPMVPGQIEHLEFEYQRHGTVNFLVGLTLYNGRMWAECLEKNDGLHFRPAVKRFLHPYGWARRIHLIMDNGPSHVSQDTKAFFAALAPRVHVLLTPVDASWLNQSELLLEAFAERYLQRLSQDSQASMIKYLLTSRREYNARFAHPFSWNWTCRDFRLWLNTHRH